MPNRIIKDSIRTSKSVNAMTDFQFRLWIYLITYVDDYGRGSADPEIIKGFVFPRLRTVRESDIGKALADLNELGSIRLYTVDDEPYLFLPNWGSHQRIQAKVSKFPEPSEDNGKMQNLDAEDSIPPESTVTHGDSPLESNPESRIQKEKDILAIFERLWQRYPKKLGKGSVSLSQKKKLYVIGEDEINRCIDRYVASCAGRDEQFIKYGSTFFNSGYVDFLDANYQESQNEPEQEGYQ